MVGGAILLVSPWLVALAGFGSAAAGYWALRRVRVEGDPGWVVIDEFAGQWIALAALSHPSALGLLMAFLLFRLLDIAKPGPVGWADRQEGPLGIMMDDVLAGMFVAVVLGLVRLTWPGSGL